MARKRKNRATVQWEKAPDIQIKVAHLVSSLDLSWIDNSRLFCFRSSRSKARAYARIWGFSRIWQLALKSDPGYCLEVLSERFDKLSEREQDKVLLHELAHIPKNFSGSLLPHIRKKGKRNFHDRVKSLVAQYENNCSSRR